MMIHTIATVCSGGYPRSEPRDSAVLLRDRMTAVPSDTLASVITALAASRAHRMYIVDEENRPIGIITTRALYVPNRVTALDGISCLMCLPNSL